MVVNDRGEIEGDIVLGHADLARHLGNLDLDIDGEQVLAKRVHLDQTRVNGAFEAADDFMSVQVWLMVVCGSGMHEPSESRDQAHLTLVDGLERIGAADAAGDSSAETDALAQAVDYRDAMRWLVVNAI